MSKGNTVFIGKNKSFRERNRRSNGYLLKRTTGRIAISVIRGLLMFGLCFMIIQPLIIRFSTSLMVESDLYDSTIVLLPRHVTLDNYRIVAELTSMPTSMINTAWISFVMSICQVVSTTLVAYGFARYEFPLKKFWFACVVMLIIIPPQTIQTALFMSFTHFDIFGIFKATTGSDINLRSSLIPYTVMCLTCMGLKDGLYIYMLRQYFKSVPVSLEEAAYVDGCGTMHTPVLYPEFYLRLQDLFPRAEQYYFHYEQVFCQKLDGKRHGPAGKADAADRYRRVYLLRSADHSLRIYAEDFRAEPDNDWFEGIKRTKCGKCTDLYLIKCQKRSIMILNSGCNRINNVPIQISVGNL